MPSRVTDHPSFCTAIQSGAAQFTPAVVLLLLCTGLHAEETADGGARLEELRGRIREVQTELGKARDESDVLQIELQEAEVAAATAAASLAEIERKIAPAHARLDELARERAAQSEILENERTQLSAQLRATYRSGRNDFVKLLLNQEDPALVGRTLAYHDYFNRARAANIARIADALARLDAVERDIVSGTAELERLRTQELARIDDLSAKREARREIIARVREHISAADRELQVLRKNERDLARLLDRLGGEASLVEEFEKLPPFTALKGNLKWPVSGGLGERFGAPRKGGRLKAQGVTINAPAGSDVHAISAGMVIFADWFRNLGLLIIVDHGDGYMSLYGHNEALAKKAGDMVAAGEVISRVGDTGGQSETTLYFEIRENGAPVDPALWCRG